MAEVKRLDRRTTRWIRYSARAITLVWATCWISLLGIVGLGALTIFPLALLLASLILLLSVSVAWRWEIIGAVVLVLEGLLIMPLVCRVITVGHFPVPNHFPYTVMFPLLLLTMALSPLIAGFLFLISWYGSKQYRKP